MENCQTYTIIHNNKTFETIFKVGDRIETKGYASVMVIQGVDEFMTTLSNGLYWKVVEEDYLLGKIKSTNADPVSDKDISYA
jgi:hypothetical protein